MSSVLLNATSWDRMSSYGSWAGRRWPCLRSFAAVKHSEISAFGITNVQGDTHWSSNRGEKKRGGVFIAIMATECMDFQKIVSEGHSTLRGFSMKTVHATRHLHSGPWDRIPVALRDLITYSLMRSKQGPTLLPQVLEQCVNVSDAQVDQSKLATTLIPVTQYYNYGRI